MLSLFIKIIIIVWYHHSLSVPSSFNCVRQNFELSSPPFAITVPVHDDTGKFQYSWEDTKIFQGHLVASGREYLGDSRERAVAGGPFLQMTCCFRENQNNSESETNL